MVLSFFLVFPCSFSLGLLSNLQSNVHNGKQPLNLLIPLLINNNPGFEIHPLQVTAAKAAFLKTKTKHKHTTTRSISERLNLHLSIMTIVLSHWCVFYSPRFVFCFGAYS